MDAIYRQIGTAVNLNSFVACERAKRIPSPWTQDAAAGKNGICLERESYAAAHHAKVIVRAIHHIPAEVIHPANVRG
jgi:hypothetical protein